MTRHTPVEKEEAKVFELQLVKPAGRRALLETISNPLATLSIGMDGTF
jgi:hypothetical protein